MKKLILFLLGCFMIPAGLMSQELSKGDIDVIQRYFGTEKASLVAEYMNLTPSQDSLFWSIYENYEMERKELGKERIALVNEYLKKAENITEEEAESLVHKSVKMEIDFKELQKTYFKRFSKAIGPVKAAQFYQFENYLNNAVNLSIQKNIPFVGELEQKHANQPEK